METSDLIQPRHLRLRAAIYVRQSSAHQVLTNQESSRLQYALKQRAIQLGWRDADIDFVDIDLGEPAGNVQNRAGYQQLVAKVALGEIGIVIAYDASRLARNCTHFYQLLDLCGRAACLIADRDGVYDPASINGRLLLGLKGQISELELHTIRGRLTAGILSKAQRGELALTLPTGLVRLETGQVVKHPDRQVQDRLAMVFENMSRLRSMAKVVRYFNEHQLLLPRQDSFGDIHWRRPTVAAIGTILKNPAYAGAFVYGRTCCKRCETTGKNRQKPRPQAEWRVCLRDRYPAYTSWEMFEKIQGMLHDNHAEYNRNKTRGIPRDGKALLHGIAYCGACGHKLVVQYKGGTQYLCNHLRQQHGVPVCQRLPADRLDEQVARWLFEALSVAEIDVAATALAEADARRDVTLAARRQQLERLRYQARLAERQFQHADPENRMVTAELERRWEAALLDLKAEEESMAQEERRVPCWAIPADLLEALKDVGPQLPELWAQGLFSSAQKKSLLRSMLDKVVLQRVANDKVLVRAVWRGGATTETEVVVSVGSLARLSNAEQLDAEIVRLARAGRSDVEIAEQLTAQGYRSPRTTTLLPSTVKLIRLQHRLLIKNTQSHPRRVRGYLTIPQLAEKLGVKRHWISDRIHNGVIRITKDASTHCYLFPDKPALLRQFRQLRDGEISELGC